MIRDGSGKKQNFLEIKYKTSYIVVKLSSAVSNKLLVTLFTSVDRTTASIHIARFAILIALSFLSSLLT